MDFDLFAQEDDDDMLSCIQLEPTQQQTDSSAYEVLPEFQCFGEDSLNNTQFSTEGFIKNGFISQGCELRQTTAAEITLSTYDFQASHLRGQSVTQFVFGEACMHIQHLLASVRGQPVGETGVQLSYYQRRRQVTLLLHLLLYTTQIEQWPLLRAQLARLRTLLNSITGADTWKSLYFANSCKGNECNVPAYHFLHGALEWKLLDLCILHEFEWKTATAEDRKSSAFPCQLSRIFEDLLTCSLYLYTKKRAVELLHSSPFPCTCFKEFWLLLQLALQKWCVTVAVEEQKLDFWSVFNRAMDKLKAQMAQFSLAPLGYYEYANWLLHALIRLHGYRSNGHFEGAQYTRANSAEAENYEFCENCTRQFLAANPSEEQLRAFICMLTPTLQQWWRPHANVPMLLWEHFHKRLNSSFYIAGAAPSNLAVACASGKAYLDRYRALLQRQPQQLDMNLSSYTLFTLLLGKTLERLRTAHANNQAQKLLGRIYTKFSLQKFLTLNETGLHHLIELFLVLALCGDFIDLAPKLRDKLLSISFEKVTPNKQIAVAKGHMALLILSAEQHCDLKEYVEKLLQQLLSVRNDLAVSKVFADALLDIFKHTSDFRNGEHLLIDAWLPNLLSQCTPAEQERTLEALHSIFAKVECSELFMEAHADLRKALNTHILPLLKQQYMNSFSAWLPQLAADFCIHSCAVGDTHSFQRLFSYFAEAQTVNRQAQPQFLLAVLESDKRKHIDASAIMQMWLKSLVLLSSVNEQVVKLSKLIVQLPAFQQLTHLSADELLRAKEPLCVFVAAVGKRYDSCNDYQTRCQLTDDFNACLRNFEKWLPPDAKIEKCELSFRFYSFIAIVIYNCPHIVYAKSKITCFFHIAITRFVLPNSVQMGKPSEPKLAQLIHKIWPVLVQGIGRLNFKTDIYINKTLSDLILKWTPHFKFSLNPKVVARPFITCLQDDNQELALFIFGKLTGMFLATQRRLADPNACLVITIFQEVISAISSATVQEADTDAAAPQERRMETFMKGTCLLTLEHIMMVDEVVPSRAMLLEHFRHLIGCRVYRNSSRLQQLLAEHLRIITKKHLAYYTFFYFDLLMKLAQISHELVAQIMDFLLQEVRVVEQKRGAGEDNRIRGCLHKLQQSIEAAKRSRTESV